MAPSPFLAPVEPSEELAAWAPISYISPCFTHYRADDATVRCLTKTQVALHEQRLLYQSLLAQAADSKNEWDRSRAELEEQLRRLQVRNAEAERLFKIQEHKLDTRLQGTRQQLDQLTQEHKDLKEVSTDKIQELQHKVNQLQNTCDDMEAERQALVSRLRDAEVTAQARRDAEQRVCELESAIAAVKDRAREMVSELRAQRDDAERAHAAAREQLHGTQHALAAEQRARRGAETDALWLAIEQQRLAAALDLERLINEPLRHTNHATTTVAHVMRSLASPIVADRSRTPLHTTYLSPPPPRIIAVQPDASVAPHPGASNVTAGAQAPVSGNPTYLTHVFASPVRGAAACAPGAAPEYHAAAVPHMPPPSAPASPSPQLITVSRPDVSHSVTGNTLTRLGRAWATTTTTAGHPHPAYPDNIPRYSPFYHSELSHTRPASTSVIHRQSAARRAVGADTGAGGGMGVAGVGGVSVTASPVVAARPRPRTAAAPAAMRSPSRALVDSYHEVAQGRLRAGSARKGARGSACNSPRPSPGPPSSRATVKYGARSP